MTHRLFHDHAHAARSINLGGEGAPTGGAGPHPAQRWAMAANLGRDGRRRGWGARQSGVGPPPAYGDPAARAEWGAAGSAGAGGDHIAGSCWLG